MQEQVNLARKLKNRYMVQNKLVSRRYKSSELYIRSLDSNKTITSAITHFAAFYFGEGIAAIDYPYDYMWPGLFTPVPVHTIPREEDYVGFDFYIYVRQILDTKLILYLHII